MECFMYNVDMSNGSIIPTAYGSCDTLTVIFPRALTDAIDILLVDDTMTLPDFIRLACAEYLLSFKRGF
ncbi:hypothetical protein [Tortoise microvirus 4]|nr:hypothetical protein [Tortoise microvirus 4]QCS37405.1 hypothetical protein [Tortoise microvirus 99]